MDNTAKQRSDDLTQQAIAAGKLEDFREDFRERLRWLKDNRPQSFSQALSHYNDVLVPNVAAGNAALKEWLQYGRLLGDLSGAGKVVAIDETGRARDSSDELNLLVLHLPDDTAVPALALIIPRELTAAQRSTLDLLANRRKAAQRQDKNE
ncbi:MAG TPA: hypothetical protein VM100_06460 [Longimicrobiales bacterium]|nr:hypothetical protein [Longimicrobiales bacterium]